MTEVNPANTAERIARRTQCGMGRFDSGEGDGLLGDGLLEEGLLEEGCE